MRTNRPTNPTTCFALRQIGHHYPIHHKPTTNSPWIQLRQKQQKSSAAAQCIRCIIVHVQMYLNHFQANYFRKTHACTKIANHAYAYGVSPPNRTGLLNSAPTPAVAPSHRTSSALALLVGRFLAHYDQDNQPPE